MAEPNTSNSARSPFPGMDPYLESRWSDIHPRLTTYASDQLQEHLPQGLVARIEQYVTLEDESIDKPIQFRPDVASYAEGVADTGSGAAAATAVGLSTAAEPVYVPRPEPLRLRRVTVVDSTVGKLITVIEVLSPANKRGEQAFEFREKQKSFLRAGVSVVEIDLLRRGRWVLSAPENWAPDSVIRPYRVCVVRGYRQSTSEMYPISLREPLPSIRVPLRVHDADAPLNLQLLINEVYTRGRYGSIDYNEPPDPPLTGEDADWADELLKEKGKRPASDE